MWERRAAPFSLWKDVRMWEFILFPMRAWHTKNITSGPNSPAASISTGSNTFEQVAIWESTGQKVPHKYKHCLLPASFLHPQPPPPHTARFSYEAAAARPVLGRHKLPSCYKSFLTKSWRLVLSLCQEVFFWPSVIHSKATGRKWRQGKPQQNATGGTTSPPVQGQQQESSLS